MRFVIQVARNASVTIEDKVTGSIDRGFVVLVGVSKEDTVEIADKMIKKLLNLRVFPDENDKTNLSLKDVGGELLIVSQFTLYADCKRGNRPSFIRAMEPEKASGMYDYIVNSIREKGFKAETGVFGAYMKVLLTNEGPFTIILDSDEL